MRYSQRGVPLVAIMFSLLLSEQAGAQFLQQGNKVVGMDAAGNAQQGCSVSLSADGNTAILGGCYDNGYAGAAWVFTRSGGAWNQQGGKLVGRDGGIASSQGFSVSLSDDGNTAIVGGPADSGSVGAAWVYTRSGGMWTQQGNKLAGGGVVGTAAQGTSVSLSADGNTAIIGGPSDNNNIGAAWVFTRNGGVWSQQGEKLVGTGGEMDYVAQGISVALSANGNTAIVGGFDDNRDVGAAWVFTRSGGVWSQQGNKLVGTGAVGSARQGFSVALSADGNTAIVGGYGDSPDGAAWVYTRNGSVWSQQGSKLVGTGAVGGAMQGYSVALSDDGNTAIVGGPANGMTDGAFWMFLRSGGVWTQHGNRLVGAGAAGNANQGRSVSLSADGRTAIVGAPADSGGAGAAWVWVYVSPTAVPGKPALLEPAKGGVAPPGLMNFTWRSPTQSRNRYWFELATDPAFLFRALDSTLADTATYRYGMEGTRTYYWRVRAWNALGWGEYSDIGDFTVVNAPDKAVLASPADSSTVPGQDVAIAWYQGSPRVDQYCYEISSDPFFASVTMDSLTTDTSHVFPTLPDGTYWWRVRAHNVAGWGWYSDAWMFTASTTSIRDAGTLPQKFALGQNYPNPFNPSTTVTYELPERSNLTLTVFNPLGQQVATLVEGEMDAGYHEVTLNASHLASGVYLYQLRAGAFVQTRKLVIVR